MKMTIVFGEIPGRNIQDWMSPDNTQWELLFIMTVIINQVYRVGIKCDKNSRYYGKVIISCHNIRLLGCSHYWISQVLGSFVVQM